MVKVVAKNFIQKEKIKDVLEVTKELVEMTLKEEGCIKYEMFQDEQNESILTMIEEWESKDALDRHMESEHFKRIVPILGQHAEKPGEINLYKKVL